MKTLIIFLFFSNFCYSQVKFYPKLGLNYSYLGEIDYPPVPIKTKWIPNFNLGLGVSFRVNKILELNSELIWNVKGGENTFMYSQEPIKTNIYRYSYLSLPVYSKLRIKKFGIFGGIEASYFMRGSITLEDGRRITLKGRPRRPDKRFDYGLLAGVSYKLQKNLFIDLRYIHGFTIIYTYVPHIQNGNVFKDGVEYHRLISLSIGYYLKKRKS